jgi:3-oxoacyl-[acyl-carrier-protein] synthase-1
MSNDVVIVGVGAMTAVGLTVAETAASSRAGSARFCRIAYQDRDFDPFVFAEVIDAALPQLVDRVSAIPTLTQRVSRMLRLGTTPLLECLEALPAEQRPGLVLALPEIDTNVPLDRARFLAAFALQAEERIDLTRSDAKSHSGRAGGLSAIGHAAQLVRSGYSRFMVGGGIDTYRDLFVLGTLDQERRLKTQTAADGFIPGEGAAFALLTTRQAASELGLPVIARLDSFGAGFESGHLYSAEPYRGDGLAAALTQLFATPMSGPIAEVYSSMNGENHWAKEWGVAYLRHRKAFRDDHRMHHPADCFGDTGAACGPTMVGVAARGIRDGYRQAPTLVYASSDRGPRAALVLSAG